MNITRAASAASLSILALALGACGKASADGAGAAGNGDAAIAAQAAAATTAASSETTPAASAASLPAPALAAWEAYARGECKANGEKFAAVRFQPLADDAQAGGSDAPLAGYLQGDFNADGTPDYAVTTDNYGCVNTSGAPAYGNAGPPVDFIISGANGYKVAQGFMAYLASGNLGKHGGRDVVITDASFNGECGPVTKVVWGWTGSKMDVLERRNDKGAKVDQEGCPVGQAAKAGGNFPPIKQGIYVLQGTSCEQAVAQSTPGKEGWPADAFAYFDTKTWGFVFEDGMPWGNRDYKGFEPAGPNRYKIKLHTFGNGDGPGFADSATISVASSTRFSETYNGRTSTYNYCPDASLPAWLRNHYKG